MGGTALLQARLISTWVSNLASQAPADVAMTALAAVFDAFTRTVIVTYATVPVPTVGPIV